MHERTFSDFGQPRGILLRAASMWNGRSILAIAVSNIGLGCPLLPLLTDDDECQSTLYHVPQFGHDCEEAMPRQQQSSGRYPPAAK